MSFICFKILRTYSKDKSLLDNQEKLFVFCDESSTTDKYMLYGGFVCTYETQYEIQKRLLTYKEETGLTDEIKWNRCKKQNVDRYKGFADIIFEYVDSGNIAFKLLSLDRSCIDYKRFFQNCKELGFYTFYKQQLLHQFGKCHYNKDLHTRFYIRLDYRTTKYPLNILRLQLNRDINKVLKTTDSPFVNIDVRDSKDCIHIQLNDLMLGAAAFCKNNKLEDDSVGETKKDMARYIRDKANIDFINSTSVANRRFNFWNFSLQGKRKTALQPSL